MSPYLALDSLGEAGYGGHDAASQHEKLRIEQSHVIRDGLAQVALGVVPQGAGERIPLAPTSDLKVQPAPAGLKSYELAGIISATLKLYCCEFSNVANNCSFIKINLGDKTICLFSQTLKKSCSFN